MKTQIAKMALGTILLIASSYGFAQGKGGNPNGELASINLDDEELPGDNDIETLVSAFNRGYMPENSELDGIWSGQTFKTDTSTRDGFFVWGAPHLFGAITESDPSGIFKPRLNALLVRDFVHNNNVVNPPAPAILKELVGPRSYPTKAEKGSMAVTQAELSLGYFPQLNHVGSASVSKIEPVKSEVRAFKLKNGRTLLLAVDRAVDGACRIGPANPKLQGICDIHLFYNKQSWPEKN